MAVFGDAYRRYIFSEQEKILGRVEGGLPPHDYFNDIDDAKKFYGYIFDNFEQMMGEAKWGYGIELGAGTGLAASILSWRDIKCIVVSDYMDCISDKIINATLDRFGKGGKYQIEIQDFNKITHEDESFDFVLCLATLHHASDLSRVMTEIRRLLKINGWLLAQDRIHPDDYSEEEKRAELNVVHGVYMDDNGSEVAITREDMGEHEIRLKEWIDVLDSQQSRTQIFWTGGAQDEGGYARIYNKKFNILSFILLPILLPLFAIRRICRIKALDSLWGWLHALIIKVRIGNPYWYAGHLRRAQIHLRGLRPFEGKPQRGSVYVSLVPPEVLFGPQKKRSATNALIAMQKCP